MSDRVNVLLVEPVQWHRPTYVYTDSYRKKCIQFLTSNNFLFQAPYQDPIQQQQQQQQQQPQQQMSLESEYWGGGIGGPPWSQQQQQFDPRTNHCPIVNPEQEVTLAKIATLEDDYSKMKRALLSSMDEEEEEEEMMEEEYRRDVRPAETNVRASRSSKLPHVNSSSSHSSSRSFNPEPPSNRDLSSRQAAHGKALNVEKKQQATVVEYDKLELRGIPPELKHERDVLARPSNVEGSQMRGRPLEKGRRAAEKPCACPTTTTTTTTTTTPPPTTPACFR